MDRQIPGAPENVNVGRVPPVSIEIAISEPQHFAQHVEVRRETEVEPHEPQEMVRNLCKVTIYN